MRGIRLVGWLAGALAVAALPNTAGASFPVPYAVVGCIKNARFFESMSLPGLALTHPELKQLEGKTIRIEGLLSPLDFGASAVFVVDEACREDLHKRYFLCKPCMTLPGMPHKDAPRQEPGTQVKLPPEALRQLDNYGRGPRR